MNKLIKLIFGLCFLFVQNIFGQIYNPTFNHKDVSFCDITKIEMTPSNTTISFLVTDLNRDGKSWICAGKDFFIRDNNTKTKYKMIKANNITICPEKQYFLQNNTLEFNLVFEPLPSNTNQIDVIEDEINVGFNFYGVDLKIAPNNITSNIEPSLPSKNSIDNAQTKTVKSEGKMLWSDSPNSEVIQLIPIGAQVKIIHFVNANIVGNNGYYKIEYNGKIGYINELSFEDSNIKPSFPSKNSIDNAQTKTVKSVAKMRQSDNPNSELIQLIPVGATVKVISFNGGYFKIEYNDKIGYINELYVEYSNLNAQNYSTLDDIKAYFTNNISKLDPIEGIWSKNITLIRTNENFPDAMRWAIIKKGDVFVIYNIEEQKITYNKDAYYSKTSSSTLYLFTMNNFDGGKDTRYASFTGNNIFKCDLDDNLRDTFVKLFPDENTIEEAKNKAQKSTGTGFAISSNGYIVTCNHVIDGATKIKIKGINGNFSNEYKATVALTDKNNDIAILKIDDADFTSLGTIPFTIQSITADVGSGIYVLGYPLTATMGDEIKLTDGIISAKSGFQGDITSYQITAAVQPGNSGGPLFDKSGNVIGVVNAKHVQAENVTYAVKSNYLINLIESLSTTPTLQKVNNLKGKPLTEQVKLVKNFVYIIDVN